MAHPGTVLSLANSKVNIHLIQSGSTLWRVVLIQQPPYHPNPADIEQIRSRLLDTLPRVAPSTYTEKYP